MRSTRKNASYTSDVQNFSNFIHSTATLQIYNPKGVVGVSNEVSGDCSGE